jgi:PAS domain S-box-containing protein
MVKILVVEDEHIVAMDLMSRLRNLGYEVPDSASSGEEAIEKAGRTRPDLVLMDIFLNGEMDGIQAAGHIRSRYNIPIIYLTAYADSNTLQRAKVTEPFGYVLKPFEERELLTTIEMALYKYRIEQRLKDSERWLATTLKSIGDGVVATDQDGRIKFMNPIAKSLTGWKQEEALGKGLIDVFRLVSAETLQPLDNPVNRVLQQGAVIGLSTNAVLVSRAGKETPVYDSAAPIKDDDGTTAGVVLIFSDITERKRAEEALCRKNRELEIIGSITSSINRSRGMDEMLDHILRDSLELLEMDAGAIYLCEQEGMRYAQLTAVAARTDAGKAVRYRQVLHDVAQDPDTIRPGDPAIVIFEGAKASATVPVMVRNGLIGIMAFYSAAGAAIRDDRSAMLLGIGAQIGIAIENQRLFKNIQDTSRYLADIINESPDAILTVDMGGFVMSFNKSASRLLKYEADEVRGRHVTSLLPDNADIDLAESKNYVREFRSKDGTVVTLNISTATLFREGRKNGIIITLKDLSAITGLKIVPLREKAVDTAQRYHFEPGAMYLFDKRKSSQSWEVFADQVKHNIQGLCITRQSPKKIRELYGLEKTPIIWLTGGEGVPGEISMKPDNLTGLGATLGKFLSQTKDGLILLDGVEYLMTRNGYEAVLKLIHFLNDKVMTSDCMVLCSIDPLTMEDRQYRILLTEMKEFGQH